MNKTLTFLATLAFIAGCNSRLSVPCSETGECISDRSPAGSTLSLADIQLAVSGSLTNVTVGATKTSTVTVTNAGIAQATAVTVGALSAPYSLSANTCGSTLAAGASCTFSVTFSPLASGAASAATPSVSYYDGESTLSESLSLSANAGNPVLTLSASGAFASTAVGASNSISMTLDNATAYDASSVSVAALASPYSVTSNTCGTSLVG